MVNEELYRLIHDAKNGDKHAYNDLVGMYNAKVYRHAFAMTNDRMEAEDIAQEAFIKAFYSLHRLENEYAFVSWMTRIVHNLCMDRIKKKKREGKKHEKMKENLTFQDRQSYQDQHLNTKLTIEEAMQRLTKEHRAVISLCDIQGFTYEEMATILKVPLGTIKSRIYSARNQLKKHLLRGEDNE
ncbi:sigma-70 family RNA polymerase sigma factor [Halobacillus rhizosphaerae]|uniref:RNA polymerase sigma factor n=1 Tax=Halobacillus rhizosphaerae TaxID=3064889 RepID=UPI00398A55E5